MEFTLAFNKLSCLTWLALKRNANKIQSYDKELLPATMLRNSSRKSSETQDSVSVRDYQPNEDAVQSAAGGSAGLSPTDAPT